MAHSNSGPLSGQLHEKCCRVFTPGFNCAVLEMTFNFNSIVVVVIDFVRLSRPSGPSQLGRVHGAVPSASEAAPIRPVQHLISMSFSYLRAAGGMTRDAFEVSNNPVLLFGVHNASFFVVFLPCQPAQYCVSLFCWFFWLADRPCRTA